MAAGAAVSAAAPGGPTADPLTDPSQSQAIARELWPTMAAPSIEPMKTVAPPVPLVPPAGDRPVATSAPMPTGDGGGLGGGPLKIVTLEELQQRDAEQSAASARADGGDWTDGESPTGETPGAGDG